MIVYAANILVNGDIVVIQYNENVTPACPGIVQTLESEASGQGSVPDYGNGFVTAAANLRGIGIAEGG